MFYLNQLDGIDVREFLHLKMLATTTLQTYSVANNLYHKKENLHNIPINSYLCCTYLLLKNRY